MKKVLMLSLIVSSNIALAQMPGMKDVAAKAKSAAAKKATEVAANCKDEKVKFCKDKELDALKACLIENKDNLTPNCKATVGL